MLESFKDKPYNTTSTPILYLIGMPIGNLNDIGKRALLHLEKTDLLICESRKIASTCYKFWGMQFPRDNHIEWNEHNDESEIDEVIDCILKTKTSVLVSDAGMPVLADPGSKLIDTAKNSGIKIQVIPGPTAITSALALAGLGGRGFSYVGFPPRKTAERSQWLQQLNYQKSEPIVIYETAYRLKKLLLEIVNHVKGKDKYIFIATDITSENEKTWDMPLLTLKKKIEQIPKGAPVIILYTKKDKLECTL